MPSLPLAGKRLRTSVRAGRSVIAVWTALVAAGSLLAFVARRAGPLPGDLILTRFVQGLPSPGIVGSLLSNADSAVWFLLIAVLAVMLLRRRWSAALFVFSASLTSVLMGVALKLIVARPRPSVELVRVYEPTQSYSFPSITAFFSMVLLGVIVYLVWRARPPRPVLAVVLGVSSLGMVTIGLSRVYVGEHWTTDVLGGWLFGAAWLILLLRLRQDFVRGEV